jgi:nucleoside-diphosphate-sugar epimerase
MLDCDLRLLVRAGRDRKELPPGAEIVEGSMEDPESLCAFAQDLDICFHLAAEVMSTDRNRLFRTNVEGTRHLCEALVSQAPGCRLVHCSSIVVYDVRWWNGWLLSDYTLSKYRGEQVVAQFQSTYGLNAAVVHPGYIYGPGDTKFLPMVEGMLRNGLPFLVAGGERDAPVVHIDDLCELLWTVGIQPRATGGRYSALSRQPFGLHDFWERVANLRGHAFPTRKVAKWPLVLLGAFGRLTRRIPGVPWRPSFDLRMVSLLSKRTPVFDDAARRDLGWAPTYSLEEGLHSAFAWLDRQESPLLH